MFFSQRKIKFPHNVPSYGCLGVWKDPKYTSAANCKLETALKRIYQGFF